MTLRRTKIVATLGPASNSPEVLEQLILAGVDVARLNFSHGSPAEHKARALMVREIAAKHGRFVALLGDLQGPKIRIGKFAGSGGVPGANSLISAPASAMRCARSRCRLG